MDVVIICELAQSEEFVPVVLSFAREQSKKLFHLLIDSFGLTVGLRVVRSRGCDFDP
jgi:hypothetical protein